MIEKVLSEEQKQKLRRREELADILIVEGEGDGFYISLGKIIAKVYRRQTEDKKVYDIYEYSNYYKDKQSGELFNKYIIKEVE